MTATTLPVFDSAEWMVNEFQDEILGDMDPSEEHYDMLRAAAVRFVSWSLALHWFHQGREVTLVTADQYGRGTWDDEAVNVTASSYYLPSEEEALGVWGTVAASITPDEIRQFVGLA